MKLKFDPNLDFQKEAINSVVDLFEGQSIMHSEFTVLTSKGHIGKIENDHGIGNLLELPSDVILENLKKIQLRNGVAQTQKLSQPYSFDIEMETGTGKTYVYLRTILELNKKYGFSKFIIVVPSIAIKEGVKKSLDITKGHFGELYDNVPYDYFIYDSSKLDQIRDFAVGDNIKIMIINIDAFKKDMKDKDDPKKANIIYRPNDKLNGMKPIDLIKETNPFVIIDEPQSVDNTLKAQDAIANLNPLCRFRYSATITKKSNLLYKLDAVDAYEMKLVKQIEVAGFEALDYNKPYIKLIKTDNKNSPITAKIEIDVLENNRIKRKEIKVKSGDDLEEITGREIYKGYIINDIYCEKGNESIDFTSNEIEIKKDEATGDINYDLLKRLQIRKTIEEHLNKELTLIDEGIKVLSLFFIDRVHNYRIYTEKGPQPGKFAQIFEKEFDNIIKNDKYKKLYEKYYKKHKHSDFEKLHNGYFAKDNKNHFKDSKTGRSKDDESTYDLIMKDKEKLLSLDEPLRFIFSHSALKEGWDNPNVFQICTLNETKSEVKKRQEIGRGLRLCVNQEGERVYDENINILTVMANEHYEQFADALQKEIEEDQNIKFGYINKHTFANIKVKTDGEKAKFLGEEKSNYLFKDFFEKGYIEKDGKVTELLKEDIKENKLNIPPEFEEVKGNIKTIVSKITSKVQIRDSRDKRKINLNKRIYLSDEFKELWSKVKYKTRYSVDFDTEEIIKNLLKDLNNNPLEIVKPKIIYSRSRFDINDGGVTAEEAERYNETYEEDIELPDIITYLQNKTDLTRQTIIKLLIESKTLDKFKINPQMYMEEISKRIQKVLGDLLIDGIKYTKIGNDEYYCQELFRDEELIGYFNKNMVKAEKSVYDHVIFDSKIEKKFTEEMEKHDNIKVYAKLPNWFKIPTPFGSYNPDWAVLVDFNGEQKLYFVVETKGTLISEERRGKENNKIICGRKHFEALNNSVKYVDTDSYENFADKYLNRS